MSLDLNPDQYEAPLICSHCGEPAVESDPAWEGRAVHLGCVDMEEVHRAIWMSRPTETELVDAVALFEAAAEYAKLRLKNIRAVKRRTCEFCGGRGTVRATDGVVAAMAICSCVGGES